MWFPKYGFGFSTSKLELPTEFRTLWTMILDSSLSSFMRVKPERTRRKVLTYRCGLVSYPQPRPKSSVASLTLIESLQWPLPLLTLGFSMSVNNGFGESRPWKRSGDMKLDWVGSILGYKQEETKVSGCWAPTFTQLSWLIPAQCVSHTKSVQLSNHLPAFVFQIPSWHWMVRKMLLSQFHVDGNLLY